jgi:NAD(P)-dependent dehydrogenase (short-subunit alcohol dehydrogenase family)
MIEAETASSSASDPQAARKKGCGRLTGKVALITGGARGIGRGIAEAFIAEGAITGIIDLKQERVDEAVAELSSTGGRVFGIAGNVAERDIVRDACLEAQKQYGQLDILVSNAMWARYQPLAELTEETLDGMIAVGFKSVVWGMQIAEELMAPRGNGVVINISSVAAARSLPNSLVYSGIKAGVSGLTRSGAVDLGPKGIRVNAIAPGTTLTSGVVRNVTAEGLDHRISRTPLGRLGEAADMGAAAVFLASDESAWINGVTLFVDGGITAAHL